MAFFFDNFFKKVFVCNFLVSIYFALKFRESTGNDPEIWLLQRNRHVPTDKNFISSPTSNTQVENVRKKKQNFFGPRKKNSEKYSIFFFAQNVLKTILKWSLGPRTWTSIVFWNFFRQKSFWPKFPFFVFSILRLSQVMQSQSHFPKFRNIWKLSEREI